MTGTDPLRVDAKRPPEGVRDGSLDLIHRNNCSKSISMRVPARLGGFDGAT